MTRHKWGMTAMSINRPTATAHQTNPADGPPNGRASDDSADSSDGWLRALRGDGAERDAAVARLHAVLLGAARFEVRRRRDHAPHIHPSDLDDLAMQAADDALMGVLRRLDDFQGRSRFTTWAYKFALLEAGVKMRRRAWQDREIPLEDEGWSRLASARPTPHEDAQQSDLLAAVREGIATHLTAHQREVLVTLAVNGVPIDVLAERLGTSRGALYKTLHDARRKLRAFLAGRDMTPDWLEA